ncbi:MAG: DNA alkylation repair protein [Micropruina sp.]|nr:DNA alkylation repair protein [Micropruina sp.]
MDEAARAWVAAVRAALAEHGDPVKAEGQQRYMKSALPYHGLSMTRTRSIVQQVARAHPLTERASWLWVVRKMWDGATHREERYGAIAVLRQRRHHAWLVADDELLALLRHLIVSGAWWDLVDDLAAHVAGDLLRADPGTMTPVLRGWAHDSDLWLRRTAILSQLLSRAATDTELLTVAIEGSLDDPDFFARKAIGWALREYSKTDEAWVRAFVEAHADRLSPLSRREALKWLNSRA